MTLTPDECRQLNDALFKKLEEPSPLLDEAVREVNKFTAEKMGLHRRGKDAKAKRPGSTVPPPQQ